jgi:translation initiation factor IF-1
LAENPATQDVVTRLLEIHKDMKVRLVEAQERQKRNADKFRKQNPNISVGDKVWFLRRNLKTHQPSDKLDYRRLGPFRVSK